jgi:hypothetical protein
VTHREWKLSSDVNAAHRVCDGIQIHSTFIRGVPEDVVRLDSSLPTLLAAEYKVDPQVKVPLNML